MYVYIYIYEGHFSRTSIAKAHHAEQCSHLNPVTSDDHLKWIYIVLLGSESSVVEACVEDQNILGNILHSLVSTGRRDA